MNLPGSEGQSYPTNRTIASIILAIELPSSVTYNDIEYHVSDGWAEIALDRPDVMNAYTQEMLVELNKAIEDATDDESVYAIVVTGNGKGFCSGKDVSATEKPEYRMEKIDRLGKVASAMRLLYDGPKPSIAAVNGPAVGGGMEIALSCDFRVMSEEAFLRDAHAAIGATPATGGGWILPRMIGEARAKEAVLLGEDITAEEADELGIAVDVVPDGESLQTAREIAKKLRDMPATALRESKRLVDPTVRSFDEHAHMVLDSRWECEQDPESDEAAAAMQEGRKPEFNREY